MPAHGGDLVNATRCAIHDLDRDESRSRGGECDGRARDVAWQRLHERRHQAARRSGAVHPARRHAASAEPHHVLPGEHRLAPREKHDAAAGVSGIPRREGAGSTGRSVVGDVRRVVPERLVPRAVGGERESPPPIVRRARVAVEVGNEHVRVADDEAPHGPGEQHKRGVDEKHPAAEGTHRPRLGPPPRAPAGVHPTEGARYAPRDEHREGGEQERRVLPRREEAELVEDRREWRQRNIRWRTREVRAGDRRP